MQLTAVLTPAEEGGFVAFNPETGTTTQGETISEAVSNLREATELYPVLTGQRTGEQLYERSQALGLPWLGSWTCSLRSVDVRAKALQL